jgi:hypothetical protein
MDTRTRVWREPTGYWKARVNLDADLRGTGGAAQEAIRAIRVAFVARDLADSDTEIALQSTDIETNWITFRTKYKYPSRHPLGYKLAPPIRTVGDFRVGDHVRILNNDMDPFHYFPVGDVVIIRAVDPRIREDSVICQGTTYHPDRPLQRRLITGDCQYVNEACLELTYDDLTDRSEPPAGEPESAPFDLF